MNSYKNSLTSSAYWIAFQCIHILPHAMSVEVKSFFAVGLGGKIRIDARKLGQVPEGKKKKKKGASPGSHQNNPLQFASFVYQMSCLRTRFPCHSTNAQSKTQQLYNGSLRKQQGSRISSQDVVIFINASVNKAAVYLQIYLLILPNYLKGALLSPW